MKERVLIIGSAAMLPETLDKLLAGKGFETQRANDVGEALKHTAADHYPMLFIAVDNKTDPVEILKQLKTRVRMPCEILVVGPNDVATAVKTIQFGAAYYWPQPLDVQAVENLLSDGSRAAAQQSNARYQREGTLLQIIKEIALTMELDGLVNILMDSAMELTDADGGAMLIHDERARVLTMKAIRGISGNETDTRFFGLDENRYQEILNGRKPVFLHPEQPMQASGEQSVSALIAAPIWWKDEPLGLLVTVKFSGSERFTNDDFKLVSLLVDEISGAVYNAVTHYRTKELTIKDDLTDAYNRRYFERYLEEEFMRARRYGSNLSLIFFDVDNLKDVNQRFGHLIGSKTLQEVAHRMILTVRGIDKVVRYGGDEFCVVLPETDTAGAYQVAERIRTIMAGKPFMINDNIPVTITGSIGIASYPMHAVSKDELVRQADKAMFSIKNKTKNAIGVAETLAH